MFVIQWFRFSDLYRERTGELEFIRDEKWELRFLCVVKILEGYSFCKRMDIFYCLSLQGYNKNYIFVWEMGEGVFKVFFECLQLFVCFFFG